MGYIVNWFFGVGNFRVGIELPKIEVRFEHLDITANVHVGGRALPSLPNFLLTLFEVLYSLSASEIVTQFVFLMSKTSVKIVTCQLHTSPRVTQFCSECSQIGMLHKALCIIILMLNFPQEYVITRNTQELTFIFCAAADYPIPRTEDNFQHSSRCQWDYQTWKVCSSCLKNHMYNFIFFT